MPKTVLSSLVLVLISVLLGCSSPTSPTATITAKVYYSKDEILQARKKFQVEVINFDSKTRYGSQSPYSDRVRLRITNNSEITLPYLTVLTSRFDSQGKMIGSSRAPSIPASNLKSGESFEYEYYPKGQLPGVEKITVEIEQLIPADVERFFQELTVQVPK